MSHHYIPFAYSPSDLTLVSRIFPEAAGCRMPLEFLQKPGIQAPTAVKLWVDSGVDGLQSEDVVADDYINKEYKSYIQQFPNYVRLADPEFQERPDKAVIAEFVNHLLEVTAKQSANIGWISVPQLPYVTGSSRNKINRLLAEATLRWKSASRYRGKLILPVIFSSAGQTNKKTERNPKVKLATDCFEASGANGVWVVDSKLDDQGGVGNFENERFPGVICFHEELNAQLPAEVATVAGPYWSLNLILWARGLTRLSAIGVGKNFQYHAPGGGRRKPVTRIAIPPLKRLARWSPDLKDWLQQALDRIRRNDAAHQEFSALLRDFDFLGDNATRQVASFYRSWLTKLEAVPAGSRPLTLYQDFSAAYVLGMGLPEMPKAEEVRDPARIAKQMMGNCL